jgi:DNA mismatch repair ATPase MutS
MYGEDAEVGAKILGITLTKSKGGTKMAGFPHNALDAYLPKLVRKGKRIAIVDQTKEKLTFKAKKQPQKKEAKKSDEPKQKKEVKHELTPCEIINLNAQKKARELYPDQFKRFVFFRIDTTSQKEYKNADEAIRAKADMNNLAYGIEVVSGVRYTGTSRINAYENFLAAAGA